MDEIKLESFITVAREGSFTKAAEVLFLSPVAIKKQIDALEYELGGILFNRKSSGCTLTAAGEVFLEYAQTILKVMNAAREDVEKATIAARGEIIAGYSLNFNYKYLGSLSIGFSEVTPNSIIQFKKMSKDEMISLLIKKQINCIFSEKLSLPCRIENELEYHHIISLPVYTIMKKGHDLSEKEIIHIDDLKNRDVFVSRILGEASLNTIKEIVNYQLIEDTDRNTLFNRIIKNAIEIFPNTFDYYCCIPLDISPVDIGIYTLKSQPDIIKKMIQYVKEYTDKNIKNISIY